MRLSSLVVVAALGSIVPTGHVLGSITFDLGGGWEATVLTDNADLVVDSVGEDYIEIQKHATLYSPDEVVEVVFTQVGSDAETVSKIIFNDLVLVNSTGESWLGFEETISGSAASFDAAASAGFSIEPFTLMTVTDSELAFSGGELFDGEIWAPGTTSGGFVINVDLSSGSPVGFLLTEAAVVPTPGSLALLLGACLVARRRRTRD